MCVSASLLSQFAVAGHNLQVWRPMWRQVKARVKVQVEDERKKEVDATRRESTRELM